MASMTMLKNELKEFMNDESRTEIAFPSSLQKWERASLHRIAQGYGLKTFSTGDGEDRYLTIQKTEKFFLLKKEKQNRTQKITTDIPRLNLSDRLITYLEEVGPPSKEEIDRLLPDSAATVGMSTSDKSGTSNYSQPAIPPLGINHQMIEFRSTLPVFEKQRAIYHAIENNPVTLICGETGCGKTTQVPQLILTSATVNKKPVRVVVLLPRRVAAVTVSNRVALERGERIGETVGYQIKCESCVSSRTQLTFCTNGVFLRNLVTSSHEKLFKSLTHIIVDEIHERDKTADFALIFIKNALKVYPHLKLIMMSATLDISVFTTYFDSAELSYEVFEVTGRLFPIKYYHLEEILSLKGLGVRTRRLSDRMKDMGIKEEQDVDAEIDPQGQQTMDILISTCFREGSTESFKYLGAYLADMNYPFQFVNAQHSETGQTALMAAFYHRNYDFAYSIMKKAAWDLRDYNGKMAKEYTDDESLLELGEGIEWYHSRRVAKRKENNDEESTAELVSAYEFANMYYDVDYDLILQVLLLIHNGAVGAVLVFLPGYDNILTMKNLIFNNIEEFDKYGPIEVFSLHSRIQMGDQAKVFKPLTNGARKVILSTNIAETSVTIEDVNYVIDTGKVKEMVYDSKICVSELRIDWITQACAKQRAGRAGRVSEGACFRLYSKEKYESFPLYQTPEMLREPLEEICLQVRKLAPKEMSIEDFLMDAVEPPKVIDITNAVEQLQVQGALDSYENLTELGNYLLQMPLEPCYAKMLLFACILKCLDPVLTIVSFLGTADPFKLPVEADMKNQATLKKLELSKSLFSDHFVYLNLFKEFNKIKEEGNLNRWCEMMYVNKSDMFTIMRTRDQLLSNLRNWSFVNLNDANKNSHHWPVVKAAITAGLSHNIIYSSMLVGKKSEERYGSRISISNTSVLLETIDEGRKKKINLMDIPSPWIVFEHKQRMQQNGGIMLKICTVVTPITIALFGGPLRNTDLDDVTENARQNWGPDKSMEKIKVNNEINFTSSEITAAVLNALKVKLNNLILNKLQLKSSNSRDDFILELVVNALVEEEHNHMPKVPSDFTSISYRPKMSRSINNHRPRASYSGNNFNRAQDRVNPEPNLPNNSSQENWRDTANQVQGPRAPYMGTNLNQNPQRIYQDQTPMMTAHTYQENRRVSNQDQEPYTPRNESHSGFVSQNTSQQSRGGFKTHYPRQTPEYLNRRQTFYEYGADLEAPEMLYPGNNARTNYHHRPPAMSNVRGRRGRAWNRGYQRGAIYNASAPRYDIE